MMGGGMAADRCQGRRGGDDGGGGMAAEQGPGGGWMDREWGGWGGWGGGGVRAGPVR